MAVLVNHTKTPVQRGIAALEDFLGEDAAQALLQVIPPQADEVACYSFPLPVDHTGVERRLRIGFPKHFPHSGLRLTVEPSPWLVWPHAMEEGLCLHGFNERPLIGTPEFIVSDSLTRLSNIISLSQMGSCEAARKSEFEREIASYWSRQQKLSLQNLILLDRPQTASKLFALTNPRQTQTIWLAADPSSLKNHYKYSMGGSPKMRALATPGFYAKLQTYPNVILPSAPSLLTWLAPHLATEDAELFSAWFNDHGSLAKRWIALELPGDPSASIYCLQVNHDCAQRIQGLGFNLRTARRKPTFAVSYAPAEILRTRLNVLNRPEILSRDLSGITKNLDKIHVVCVGVGSLGSIVALQLARSGVGHLTLIDPDHLVSANLGRHVLGAEDLGRSKVKALQDKILRDLPITEVSTSQNYADVVVNTKPEIFENADLVVVTTADWQSESLLWRIKSEGTCWSLLQAWSEPHTCVGHALIAPAGAYDAQYLFTETGDFKDKFTDWPDGGSIALPACGESFIPGGSVGMMNIAAMVSQAALRVLNGNIASPLWLSSVNRVEDVTKMGGEYRGPKLPENIQQVLLERDWPETEENDA